MDATFDTAKVNTRLEEIDFLLSIFSDLVMKYPQHNKRILEELISHLRYRKESEETTVKAKAQSEEYQRQKITNRKFVK